MAITGVGAVTAFGTGVDALWRGISTGGRALKAHARLLDSNDYGPLALCDLPLGESRRATRLALAAAQQISLTREHRRLAIVVATTLGEMDGFLAAQKDQPEEQWGYGAIAAELGREFRAEGPVQTVSVACASGNAAIALGREWLVDQLADVVMVVGVDVLNDFVCSGFLALRAIDRDLCRPFDRDRGGLNLGEAAGGIVLERASDSGASSRALAFVCGSGSALDGVHMTGPDPSGRGLARAIAAALSDAEMSPDDITAVSAHGTATRFNDAMEARALQQVFGERTKVLPTHSIKGAVGHTLGAAGVLDAIVCVRALHAGIWPPTSGIGEPDPALELDVTTAPRVLRGKVVLSTAAGFGGINSALVIAQ